MRRRKEWINMEEMICLILGPLGHVLEWRYLYYIHSLDSFELIIFMNAVHLHPFVRRKINSLSGCVEPRCAESYQPTPDAFMQNFVIRICDGERWRGIVGMNNSHCC